ncbi:ribonuclease H1 [Aphelenchoides avenae]|nr:ribonuclease H1 [Aphelenchus avenae]
MFYKHALGPIYPMPSKDPWNAVAYIDGCCMNNGRAGARAGAGVFFGEDNDVNDMWNVAERVPGEQTNSRAELYAAILALEKALEKNVSVMTVLSDSIYTLGAIRYLQTLDGCNMDLVGRLHELMARLRVRWFKVPGHQCSGNVRADHLAKYGANSPPIAKDLQ